MGIRLRIMSFTAGERSYTLRSILIVGCILSMMQLAHAGCSDRTAVADLQRSRSHRRLNEDSKLYRFQKLFRGKDYADDARTARGVKREKRDRDAAVREYEAAALPRPRSSSVTSATPVVDGGGTKKPASTTSQRDRDAAVREYEAAALPRPRSSSVTSATPV